MKVRPGDGGQEREEGEVDTKRHPRDIDNNVSWAVGVRFSFFPFFFCCTNDFLLLAHVVNNDEWPLHMSVPNNNAQEHKKAQMTVYTDI